MTSYTKQIKGKVFRQKLTSTDLKGTKTYRVYLESPNKQRVTKIYVSAGKYQKLPNLVDKDVTFNYYIDCLGSRQSDSKQLKIHNLVI